MPVPDKPPVDIAANLSQVKSEIALAAETAARKPSEITLVAVSKSHGVAKIEDAIAAGQRVFGENRVQEAQTKWPTLKGADDSLRLHLIGPLQRNKAAAAVGMFDVIETIDRLKLARAVARHMDELDRRPVCYIQVNTGEEPQKAGVLPSEADGFITACLDDLNLPIKGLMCIPPLDEEPSLHFALLGEIARRNGLADLSMGMSADYDIAVRFGATHVRIGTAIFGPRGDVNIGEAEEIAAATG